jgi:probable LLM family oxidoreductase
MTEIKHELSFGLDTFGDINADDSGVTQSAAQTIRNIVDQGIRADEVGINHFNIGEHHRDDFAVSAPDTVLAGLATRTKNITLGTAVTVLSSDDPVRVYERFATLDALSNGRAEITAGRGSFTESFPLFGYELKDYHDLFEQKLELLVELLGEGAVTWSGTMRASLENQQVYPKTERGRIPLRVGVGGSPESVIRAARLGAPLTLAIIGGDPARFAPFSGLYHDALEKFGRESLPISIHSHGHVAETDQQAVDELWPHYELYMTRLGRERGWPPITFDRFMGEIEGGSAYVGSPETVAQKIAYALKSVGASRFDFKYANGPVPHSKLISSIELYGEKVIPRVRELMQ